MAHYAKVLQGVVTKVIVAEKEFIDSYVDHEPGSWVQTSYNTIENTHALGGTPFRKNYAGVGYTWDEDRNAFIPPQPQNDGSWVLNETTCRWERPVALPGDADGLNYAWNEDNYQADNSTGWVSSSEGNTKA